MALNINITEDIKIISDTHNVIVQRKHIVDPTKSPNWAKLEAKGASSALREEWRDVSYHPSVEQAVKSIMCKKVNSSDATSLTEVLDEIKRFETELSAILKR
ncbi:hypothetical protein AB1282_00560 [Gottfriedia sp. S16(2024)]|uniref:hypothetical protein n=1 Tax=Gottfriedia sp. S16(2024) TaxID=3162883 RepID=UPI003D1F3B82